MYGSEYEASKTTTEQILDLRYTLRYLVLPIKTKSYLFGDNRSVETSSTLPHSTLGKRHTILAYHQVREAIASNVLANQWIQTGYNLSDMLSKHWDHPSVYNKLMKLLITKGSITLIPQEATQEKYTEVSKLKSKQQTNHIPTRGEYQDFTKGSIL